MNDPRYVKLANLLVNYSVKVQSGENVLINTYDMTHEMTDCIIEAVVKAGGNPIVNSYDTKVLRSMFINCTEESWKLMLETDLQQMQKSNAFIAIRNNANSFEYSDVPPEKMAIARKIMRPVTDYRVKNTKWCVLRWPSSSMAQSANMSTKSFEDFYFDVCTMDYERMNIASKSLVELMNKTDKVRIVSPNTDITFSIKNIPAVACVGEMNIPDGEVFTAPVVDSIDGVIQFNTPTVYDGKKFDNVKLMFENGQIITATSSDTKALNKILDSDVGSRYVGEFAIGFNPYITTAMCDILFDEKIAGSIHLTPGACYDEASNGNKSVIHWDMVLIQTEAFGGGQIYFDDILIRNNGIFVLDELKTLNQDNLKG